MLGNVLKIFPLPRKNILSTTLLILCGCSGTYDSSLNFNPGEPIRIAILPFVQVTKDGEKTEDHSGLIIDKLNFAFSDLKDSPAHLVQGIVQSELSKASLDIIPPGLVEAELIHAGYGAPGTNPVSLDQKKVLDADPIELCTNVLSCDAVMLGKVIGWDRNYYGIQSVAQVGINLKLISARNKKILFEVTAKDSDSRGITKGPTGLTDLVIAPLQGLDNKIIIDLAEKVVSMALEPLARTNKPDYLSEPPPAIIASAHDRTGISFKSLEEPNDASKLLVVMLGSPGNVGSFDVVPRVEGIPMVERAPGHYLGEYIPFKNEPFSKIKVRVRLADKFGRTTQHIVGE